MAANVNARPVNRRALRRYGEFWRALGMVDTAVGEAARLAAKAVDVPPERRGEGENGGRGPWLRPSAEELRAAVRKAGGALHVMSSAAKRWEAELVSREWRR